MKFSIVIPTRNRLDLLKYAVASVLKQKYDDWEIIISDNASSEDVEGYVKSLNEPRVKYFRSDVFLSITESWNRCVEFSTGDYVLMIGDDDILLKNYFQILKNLIEKYQQPDLIYTNAFLYAYPNVIPDYPNGIFQPFGSLHGMPKKETPYWLDIETRRAVVQETLKFNSIYSTNMQHAMISRVLLEKVKKENKLFYSPYPDIYAMSALFLEADRILIYPNELVVIGISSKSHGCYAINKREKDAIDFLNIKNELTEISTLQSVLLPGFVVFNYWLGAIEIFKNKFDLKKLNLDLNYSIYRNNQINYIMYFYSKDKAAYRNQFKKLMKHLTVREKFSVIYPSLFNQWFKKTFVGYEKIIPGFLLKAGKWILRALQPTQPPPVQNSYTPLNPPPGYLLPNANPNPYATILDIFEQVDPIDCSR